MERLNFPACEFRFKNSENRLRVFDIIRKKFVVLQPEEWVRQHLLHYLVNHKNYPKSLISVEKQLRVNSLPKRYDIVVYNRDASIEILAECKSPDTPISQNSFDQIARYNMPLKARYLVLTNGIQTFVCQVDHTSEKYAFLPHIPDFSR